ncbi:hypothetical protein [Thermococcus sp.]|uniref:hypothetical protein n=1 Tax=Thermococcus sp. TaxID=35749 RepID=UPI002638EA4A|nr:hypothetical protein [Thermococcus sp.]
MKPKIALPKNEFELKGLYNFLELIFDDDEHRIGIAEALLERLRQKRETYTEDWLEVILEYLDEKDLLQQYHYLVNKFEEGEITKTRINKIIEKELRERGYPAAKLRKDWSIVKKTLVRLGIVSRTSNRLNLSWEFVEKLNTLAKFYNLWRAGEL